VKSAASSRAGMPAFAGTTRALDAPPPHDSIDNVKEPRTIRDSPTNRLIGKVLQCKNKKKTIGMVRRDGFRRDDGLPPVA
jgi:hypothetical protein